MKTSILHIFTRTPLHVGAGSSVGAVDQPVQRERHTGFPIIPGSSIKGVLRDHFRVHTNDHERTNLVFGDDTSSGGESSKFGGAVSIAEGKILLFPVRSAKGGYALATSPLALSRYQRDAGPSDLPQPPTDLKAGQCLANRFLYPDGQAAAVVLEEYVFDAIKEFPPEWAEHLSNRLDDAVLRQSRERFVLLSDEDFAHFCLNATQVNQHVRISDETGTVDGSGLFNEETVPSETLFYSVFTPIANRSGPASEPLAEFLALMAKEQLLQFGGNGTTGLGFCTTQLETPK